MKFEPRAHSRVRCALCHGSLDDLAAACSSCSTKLHDDCWPTVARCPTLGCEGLPITASRRARLGNALVAVGVTIMLLTFAGVCFGVVVMGGGG